MAWLSALYCQTTVVDFPRFQKIVVGCEMHTFQKIVDHRFSVWFSGYLFRA